MNFELMIDTNLEDGIKQVSTALGTEGFGVLTRIDFDQKIKEKLGITLPKTTILGACNPKLAYEAYQKDPNMLLLIPCNVVLEELEPGKLRVKLIKPSAMMKFLDSSDLPTLAKGADEALLRVVHKLGEK